MLLEDRGEGGEKDCSSLSLCSAKELHWLRARSPRRENVLLWTKSVIFPFAQRGVSSTSSILSSDFAGIHSARDLLILTRHSFSSVGSPIRFKRDTNARLSTAQGTAPAPAAPAFVQSTNAA